MLEKFIKEKTHSKIERRALLVSVYQGAAGLEICKEHLDELELLCETYGIEAVEKFPCQIRKFDASTFITSGKLEELIQLAREKTVDVVIFDDEIAPSQQRNLEKLFNIPVIDRTEVILGVFAQRAHTREAQLQVELAQLQYQAPRLKRMWTHLSRQAATAGGGAYLKGAGEKQIEIDRRLLKNRMTQLLKEIEEIKDHRNTQRILREKTGIPVFAIVGYTNAGKSTLLNALTDAGIFVEDKLFATLDTTTRKFTLPNNQDVLLIDTVGFIRKLPHLLVAAFRSTLEEAVQADILLHVVDVSHPMAEEQIEATFEVLKELGAENKPIITLLNKIDKCENKDSILRIRLKHTKTVPISAVNREGFDDLIQLMLEELKNQRKVINLRIPQKDYHIVSQVIREGKIENQDYDENDVLIQVELPNRSIGKLEKYIEEK
jgi:GTP-binding protein HflX